MGKINEEFMVQPEEATDEEIIRGLELLAREKERKHKIETGVIKGSKKWSEMTEDEKDKMRAHNKKRNIRIKLLCQKAQEAGITVTDDEIDEALLAGSSDSSDDDE